MIKIVHNIVHKTYSICQWVFASYFPALIMILLHKWQGDSTVSHISLFSWHLKGRPWKVWQAKSRQKIPSYTKLQQTAMQLVVCPAGCHYQSPITISQWNYHHKTHHIYTYSSELILTHIHHCQPTLSTVNRIWWWWAFSLSLPPDEQCHRWNAEIRTNAGAAVLPARANKRTKANKSAFMGWTQSHTHFL